MDCPVSDPCPGSTQGVSAQLFFTLINALMASKCSLNQPSNYPIDHGPQIEDGDEFDFIIVGGGSAGSVLANKLSENRKWNVLVLEAGGLPTTTSEIPSLLFSLQGTQEDWQYKTEQSDKACKGYKERRCRWPRGKVLGGCSSINAMLYLRGLKEDYDNWGVDGWDYESVKKIFQINENLQSEKLFDYNHYGRVGNQPLNLIETKQPLIEIIKGAAKELGIPSHDYESNIGYFEALLTVENGVRANTGKSFLGKARIRENLMVSLNSHVEKLIIDSTKTVRGVSVNIKGKKVQLKATKEVILSAGAINTPQILMLSGIGPEEHLKNLGIEVVKNLPVGQNLQDHSIFLGIYAKINDDAVREDHPLDELYKYFMHRQGISGSISITNLIGFIDTKNETDQPNLQLHHVLFMKKDSYLLPEIMRVMGFKEKIAKEYIGANLNSHTFLIMPTLIRPKSKGKIELASSDPYAHPKIYPNYYEDPKDLETMMEGIQYLIKLLKTEKFKKYQPRLVNLYLKGCENYKYASEEYWKCATKYLTTTLYHPVGTCKMGPETDGGVVDKKLKVYGINNLRVADASIMPLIPSANTNAACLMIGQKGARIIMTDWSYKDEL